MTFLTGLCLGTFLSASAADGWTTHLALARGGVERNPLLRSEGVMVGVKAGTGALTTVAVAEWEKTHPKLTRWLLVAGTAAYAGVAMHNARVQR